MKTDRASTIAKQLPYLRRYARALLGTQDRGDRAAAATLEAILDDPARLDASMPPKTALFRALHKTVFRAVHVSTTDESDLTIADKRLSTLTLDARAALLLYAIEEFTAADIGHIMECSAEEADAIISYARQSLKSSVAGHVLIIEDETLIAMDLKALVTAQGHTVTGIARTRESAVALGLRCRPDLILADVRLADQSSGIDAVHALLAACGKIPVIYITAFPETLLTGKRPEPAFVITKPYTEEQVHSAVSQAMFFAIAGEIVAPA
ncbi:Response regulator receiver domain-containing protein [Cognatiyoonia koreensis]|uniref:Response regulator receiver domain-containing protein n=1 Tax=Cognatiyoonia koreensis TaxID=364200 RepID=A0A1I0RXU6_9RHOB|nr:response regulator [Cognatiyoonia koreensis]SEW46225.1 Response regulator receiver domain-containing protein [Cognatiyoonia koreensis]